MNLKEFFRPTLPKIVTTIILGAYLAFSTFIVAVLYIGLDSPGEREEALGTPNPYVPICITLPFFLIILPFMLLMQDLLHPMLGGFISGIVGLILEVLYVYSIACIICSILTFIVGKLKKRGQHS